MRNVIVVLIFAFIISSCSKEVDTAIMPFKDEEIFNPLLIKMAQENIWFEKTGKSSIRVKNKDFQEVLEMSQEIANSILPTGRSAAYNSEIQIRLKPKLREKGIEFETVCFDGSEFIVWEAKDAVAIESMVNEIMRNTEITTSHEISCT